jgi:hypothetical protein
VRKATTCEARSQENFSELFAKMADFPERVWRAAPLVGRYLFRRPGRRPGPRAPVAGIFLKNPGFSGFDA